MNPDLTESIQFSVVLCTFNRSYRLENALKSIAESASRSALSTEIVVVDNNSTDDTPQVVASIAASSPVPVRYVFEKLQGLSFAKNRGLKEAKGEVIAFTDDDCIPDSNWVAAIWREFVAHPDVAIVGGRVDLHNPADHPVTIRPLDQRVRYTDASQIYTLIIGCNLAVRRSVAVKLDGFDPALGGFRGVVADDIDYVYSAFRRGFPVQFIPEAVVSHDHGRRSPEQLHALARNYTKGRGGFFCKYGLKGDRTIWRHAWWEVRSQVGSLLQPVKPGGLSSGHALAMLAYGAILFFMSRLRVIRP